MARISSPHTQITQITVAFIVKNIRQFSIMQNERSIITISVEILERIYF